MRNKLPMLAMIALLTLPAIAAAQTVSTFLGLFNICAGLMVVAAFLAFAGGFIQYLVLLGTERREKGLQLMLWGVTILFVLVVLLGVINILQGPIAFLIGVVAILFLCFVVLVSVSKSGGSGGKPDDTRCRPAAIAGVLRNGSGRSSCVSSASTSARTCGSPPQRTRSDQMDVLPFRHTLA